MPNFRGFRPKYTTAEEVKERVIQYFNDCANEEICPTFTGLAYELDMDRHTLLQYQNASDYGYLMSLDDTVREEISTTIKEARKYIEYMYENKLINGKNNPVGTIFALKNNYKWVDKQEIVQENRTIEVSLED